MPWNSPGKRKGGKKNKLASQWSRREQGAKTKKEMCKEWEAPWERGVPVRGWEGQNNFLEKIEERN